VTLWKAQKGGDERDNQEEREAETQYYLQITLLHDL